jgi:hypothetical protein
MYYFYITIVMLVLSGLFISEPIGEVKSDDPIIGLLKFQTVSQYGTTPRCGFAPADDKPQTKNCTPWGRV